MNEKEKNTLPINVSLEKAKNEMRYCLNQICNKYEIPNAIVGLLLESLLNEERQQKLSLLVEQFEQVSLELNEIKKEQGGE